MKLFVRLGEDIDEVEVLEQKKMYVTSPPVPPLITR